jgi:hypothetical protein
MFRYYLLEFQASNGYVVLELRYGDRRTRPCFVRRMRTVSSSHLSETLINDCHRILIIPVFLAQRVNFADAYVRAFVLPIMCIGSGA